MDLEVFAKKVPVVLAGFEAKENERIKKSIKSDISEKKKYIN